MSFILMCAQTFFIRNAIAYILIPSVEIISESFKQNAKQINPKFKLKINHSNKYHAKFCSFYFNKNSIQINVVKIRAFH